MPSVLYHPYIHSCTYEGLRYIVSKQYRKITVFFFWLTYICIYANRDRKRKYKLYLGLDKSFQKNSFILEYIISFSTGNLLPRGQKIVHPIK